MEAVSYPQVVRTVVPITTPQHPGEFVAIIPILTPFKNDTCYAMQAVAIRLKTSYWGSGFIPLIFTTCVIIISIQRGEDGRGRQAQS